MPLYYPQIFIDAPPLFSGAARLVEGAAAPCRAAFARWAKGEEIESTLEFNGLKRYFLTIAAAEEFHRRNLILKVFCWHRTGCRT